MECNVIPSVSLPAFGAPGVGRFTEWKYECGYTLPVADSQSSVQGKGTSANRDDV